LIDDERRPRGNDSDARGVPCGIRLRYRKGIDVVAAAREEADHAREHARLVIDENGKAVALGRLINAWRPFGSYTSILPSSEISSRSSSGERIISLCALPDGIIGKQFSLGSTTQSNSTGRLTLIISMILSSSSLGLVARIPTAP